MLVYDYEKELEKIEDTCMKNNLEFEFIKASFPIKAIIRPDAETRNQMRMDLGEEHETFRDGEIAFIFADELKMQIVNDFMVTDKILNRIKNQVKRLHYIYLQMYFKEKTQLD